MIFWNGCWAERLEGLLGFRRMEWLAQGAAAKLTLNEAVREAVLWTRRKCLCSWCTQIMAEVECSAVSPQVLCGPFADYYSH